MAEEYENIYLEELKQSKKLILILDLDHTILHAAKCDN